MARIAGRGIESSQRLRRHRWVVERTPAWLARFRRPAIRYERSASIHLAVTTLACALVTLNHANGSIRRFYSIGRRDMQPQEVVQRVRRHLRCEDLLVFASTITGPLRALGGEHKIRLSSVAAVGFKDGLQLC